MNKTSKRSVSSSEYALIERLNQSNMASFSAGEAAKLMGWEKNKAYKITSSLKRKELAESAGGRYVLTSVYGRHDRYSTASNLVWPSYISFWTALNYYKYTEQLPQTIFIATTKQKKDQRIGKNKIKYVKIARTRFFGYRKTGEATIAEKEKAMVDCLLLPRYAGGIQEISKCLKNAWNEIDKELLIDYAMRMNNKTLLKRLGYLIQENQLTITKKLFKKLEENIGKGYSKLDPQLPKTGKYNEKWKLIVNQ